MNNVILKTAFLLCCCLFSCENSEKPNVETLSLSEAPVSQDLKDQLKLLTDVNYTYKNLSFVKGTLDDALQEAKMQNKYLYVITSMENCSLCNTSLKLLDLNNQGVKKEVFDKYLFYVCDYSELENRYLFWALNSAATPNSFLFKDSKIINYGVGFKGVNSSGLFADLNHINTDFLINNRLPLKGQDALDFINLQIQAYTSYKNPNSTKEELTLAYNSIKESLNIQETYFNQFIATQLEEKLGIVNQDKSVSKTVNPFNDEYTQRLYENLN